MKKTILISEISIFLIFGIYQLFYFRLPQSAVECLGHLLGLFPILFVVWGLFAFINFIFITLFLSDNNSQRKKTVFMICLLGNTIIHNGIILLNLPRGSHCKQILLNNLFIHDLLILIGIVSYLWIMKRFI